MDDYDGRIEALEYDLESKSKRIKVLDRRIERAVNALVCDTIDRGGPCPPGMPGILGWECPQDVGKTKGREHCFVCWNLYLEEGTNGDMV